MLYRYIAAVIFGVISVIVPLSMLVASRLLGFRPKTNPLKERNYESGEETIGAGRSIMFEYIHYFPVFIAFEILGIVVLAWSITGSSLETNEGVVALLIFGFVLSLFGFGAAKVKY